ncbi:MAG: DNA alkylation repair protein [Saprospiraceae bacterium]|nr:DNA alkylation repair protein [Saprospiraceae bacterium]
MKNTQMQDFLREVKVAVRNSKADAVSQRRCFKKGYSFSKFPLNKQVAIWDYIWLNEKDFWIKVQAFFFCETTLKKDADLLYIWPVIRKWQDQVDHWGLCDCLAKIYSKVLELDPEQVYPLLMEWNKSGDAWKRRQSLTSLVYYASVRKSVLPFTQIEAPISQLISDPEYYVQKALGWTIRELTVCYPEEAWKYLLEQSTLISSIAYPAATAKLTPQQKSTIKQIRATSRKGKP